MSEQKTLLINDFVLWLPEGITSIAIFIISLLLARLFQKFCNKIGTRINGEKRLVYKLFATLGKTAIITLGGITALGSMGINVSALVASLGLSGFALSFALKDTLSNTLAGVMIILYQPFKCGDNINTAGYEGTVSKIDLRYTYLNGSDKTILIPNSNYLSN